MRRRFIYSLVLIALSALSVKAQDSDLLKKYRNMTLEYNQDIKSAERNIELSRDLEKSANADFLAKLSANADFTYTGNPMELSANINGLPLGFKGENISYGTSVAIVQPIYKGGMIRENSKMAGLNTSLATNNAKEVKSNLCYETDSRYWNTVARKEIYNISLAFKKSMSDLVNIVRERVEVDFANKNDLLMAEVKLNDAEYQSMQAKNNYEIGRMALNSIIGVKLNIQTEIEEEVTAIKSVLSLDEETKNVFQNRAKILMAENKVSLQESALKLKDAKYLPQFLVGASGMYSTPGYNFKSDLDANYAVYAKISIPIFEWGKRKSDKRASKQRIEIAKDNYSKQKDMLVLEVQTAFYTYSQAVERVLLTANSLEKAVENESMALDRYKQGSISLIELIDAQVFHQKSEINYVQSRMNAQVYRSQYLRALGVFKF
jgi:outer membrane protein TolC